MELKEEKKYLGIGVLVLIAINTILDSGIYFLPAIGASISGPASILSWFFLILVFLYISGCFAELVSMFPKAGGIYEFGKQTYGKIPSFVIGWLAWLIANVAMATLVIASLNTLVPTILPLIKLGAAILLVFLMNYLAFLGIKNSTKVMVAFAILSIITLCILIVTMALDFKITYLQPFFMFDSFSKNFFFFFLTSFYLSEVFFGIEGVAYLSEEAKDPKKTVPKAIFVGMSIICFLVLSLVITSFGFEHWAFFGSLEVPYSHVMRTIFGDSGNLILSISIFLIIIGTAITITVETPYLLLAMSRDKLFLPHFLNRHKKYDSPYYGIILQMIITIVFLIIGITGNGYKTLISMVVPLSILLYILIIAAIPILRIKRKDIYRTFKVPFGKTIPFLIICFLISLLVFWIAAEEKALYLFLVTLFIALLGFPFYFLMSLYFNPKMITKFHDLIANLELLTEKITLPIKIRREAISYLGNIVGKKVLEFGAGVGTLTEELAEKVGTEGKIYTTSFSTTSHKIISRRIKDKDFSQVHLLLDEYHTKRVHPEVPYVDCCISLGIASYIQDPERVLREINARMSIRGKIVLIDYANFFKLIPSAPWLKKNENIIEIFEKNGFRVNIIRKKSLLWDYIIIHGEKTKNVYSFYYLSSEIKK